jgi:hypothetical protein
VLRDRVRQGSDSMVNTATMGAHRGAHRHRHAPRRSTSPRPGQTRSCPATSGRRTPQAGPPAKNLSQRPAGRDVRPAEPSCEPPRSPSASGSCSEMSPLTSPVPPFQSAAG